MREAGAPSTDGLAKTLLGSVVPAAPGVVMVASSEVPRNASEARARSEAKAKGRADGYRESAAEGHYRGRSRSANMECVRGSATGEEVYEGTVFSCKDPGHLGTRGCPDGHPGLDRLSATGTRFRIGSSRIWCHEVGTTHAGFGLVVRFLQDQRPPRGRRPALGDDKAEAQAQYPARPDNRPTPKEALVVGDTVPRCGRGCGTPTGLSIGKRFGVGLSVSCGASRLQLRFDLPIARHPGAAGGRLVVLRLVRH